MLAAVPILVSSISDAARTAEPVGRARQLQSWLSVSAGSPTYQEFEKGAEGLDAVRAADRSGAVAFSWDRAAEVATRSIGCRQVVLVDEPYLALAEACDVLIQLGKLIWLADRPR